MEFTTGISTSLDRNFNFDAVENYNKFLQNNSSFVFGDSPRMYIYALIGGRSQEIKKITTIYR